MKAALLEAALVLIVSFLGGVLLWRAGYDVGFDAGMDRAVCVQESVE